MTIRIAIPSDIPAIQIIRNAVKENTLSDPNLIPDELVEQYLTERGMGWVALKDSAIVGFAIVDFQDPSIWALFIHPDFEGKGIGKQLLQVMLAGYFQQNDHPLWLSTDEKSRAAVFYEKQGWKNEGPYGKNEIKMTLRKQDWIAFQH
ncbi:MAG: hypothetical protein RLY16_45 [Bacteroidota bacterium]